MGRFQLELIYLYFPPSSHPIYVCFCPVGLSLVLQHYQEVLWVLKSLLSPRTTPTRPVDNVVIATKGLQDRNIHILDGTTVENKGKLILTEIFPSVQKHDIF